MEVLKGENGVKVRYFLPYGEVIWVIIIWGPQTGLHVFAAIRWECLMSHIKIVLVSGLPQKEAAALFCLHFPLPPQSSRPFC